MYSVEFGVHISHRLHRGHARCFYAFLPLYGSLLTCPYYAPGWLKRPSSKIIIIVIIEIIIIIKQAPGWLKRPSGATFGFGGQLATFNKKLAPDGNPGVASVQV